MHLKKGTQKNLTYLGRQVNIEYEVPMNEVVVDFFDKLKSISRGYASMEYELVRYDPSDVVKLDVLIMGKKWTHCQQLFIELIPSFRGRQLASKLKDLIPRQMFDVAFKLQLVLVSLRGKISKLYGKMFLRNVMAVM